MSDNRLVLTNYKHGVLSYAEQQNGVRFFL